MAVLRPLKVTITNFDDAVSKFNELKNEKTLAEFDGEALWLTQPKHPHLNMGSVKFLLPKPSILMPPIMRLSRQQAISVYRQIIQRFACVTAIS